MEGLFISLPELSCNKHRIFIFIGKHFDPWLNIRAKRIALSVMNSYGEVLLLAPIQQQAVIGSLKSLLTLYAPGRLHSSHLDMSFVLV